MQGRLRQRSYETREGEKRSVIELDVDEIGPSLRYATAKVTKANRGGGSNNSFGGGSASQSAPSDDPWGSAPQSNFGGGTDEPPF